jgi:hypothetical protein
MCPQSTYRHLKAPNATTTTAIAGSGGLNRVLQQRHECTMLSTHFDVKNYHYLRVFFMRYRQKMPLFASPAA